MTATVTPYVKHLLAPKEAAAKLRLFETQQCLFLRPDWPQVVFDVHSLSRLDRVR
jgi:hypothetical protein